MRAAHGCSLVTRLTGFLLGACTRLCFRGCWTPLPGAWRCPLRAFSESTSSTSPSARGPRAAFSQSALPKESASFRAPWKAGAAWRRGRPCGETPTQSCSLRGLHLFLWTERTPHVDALIILVNFFYAHRAPGSPGLFVQDSGLNFKGKY